MTNARIHPTAIIDPTATIHPSVSIGAYCIIGPQVSIGEGCVIDPHVVVHSHTRMGQRNRIFSFASVGADCQDLKYKGEQTWLHIGDDNTIREHCTLHRGTTQDQALTVIGNRNLLMVNTHIAHDVQVGNDCILANNVGLAGHIHIADFVIIGGNSGVHQFCKIGAHAMIGGGSTILKDVPAFVLASGNPSAANGINIEGLKRRGFSSEAINAIRNAFKVVYKQDLILQDALAKLKAQAATPEVTLFIQSIEASTRSIVR